MEQDEYLLGTDDAELPRLSCSWQEFLDRAALSLLPGDPEFERVVAACMRSWTEGGGSIDVARDLVGAAHEAGLVVEEFRPLGRIARAGGPEWGWLGGFLASYLPRLVERGQLDRELAERHLARWEELGRVGAAFCVTPTVAELVLRKPL